MFSQLGGHSPPIYPTFRTHPDSQSLNYSNLPISSKEQMNLEELLSENSKNIKGRMFNNKEQNIEQLKLLLEELNTIRSQFPLLRDNIRLIHRVRREINKVSVYEESSFPPFVTIMEHEQKDKSIHPMNAAKLLYESNISGIKDVSSKGRNKFGINFINPFTANEFVKNQNKKLKEHGFKTFIPQRMLYSRGIVKKIGDNITEEDFINFGHGIRGSKKIKIVDATRFNYKTNADGVEKIIPGSTFMLVFAGNLVPQEINLFYTKRDVTPYVNPVTLCYNCLRFGHNKFQCKNKTKCFYCGDDHDKESCSNKTQTIKKCPNCNGNHEVNNRECDEYKRQKQINQAIADHNISYFEANKLFPKKDDKINESIKVITEEQNTRNMADFPNTLQAEIQGTQTSRNKDTKSYASQVIVNKKRKTPVSFVPNYDNNKHKQLLFPDPCRSAGSGGLPSGILQRVNQPLKFNNKTKKIICSQINDMSLSNPDIQPIDKDIMEEVIVNTSDKNKHASYDEKALIEDIIGTQNSIHNDPVIIKNYLDNLNKL